MHKIVCLVSLFIYFANAFKIWNYVYANVFKVKSFHIVINAIVSI